MKRFSEKAWQKISADGAFYVYALVDPRNDTVFYIGKGTENRVFSHEKDAEKPDAQETAKLKTIQEIKNAGKQVTHLIIHWGLEKEAALAAEAALISLMQFQSVKLTNIASGHHCIGAMTAEELEKLYGAKELKQSDVKDNLLLVNVNKLYHPGMDTADVYEIARGNWKVDLERASKCKYVLAVYRGIVIGCFAPTEWQKVTEENKADWPKVTQDKDLGQRAFFTADPKKQNDRYLGKLLGSWCRTRGAQNPIRYISPTKG